MNVCECQQSSVRSARVQFGILHSTPYNKASKYLVLEIGLKNLSFPCTLYLGHHVVLQSYAIMFPCNLYLDLFTTAIRKQTQLECKCNCTSRCVLCCLTLLAFVYGGIRFLLYIYIYIKIRCSLYLIFTLFSCLFSHQLEWELL